MGAPLQAANFDYDLPADLIAQTPRDRRDMSRMLVVDRCSDRLEDRQFIDLPHVLQAGDLLVANESRVIPARLIGVLESGGRVELLLVRAEAKDRWWVLARPARKLRPGTRLYIGDELSGTVIAEREDGMRSIQFEPARDFNHSLETVGMIPLPPYIKQDLADPERYQTVYARHPGSVAAPTAGLHFTPSLLAALRSRGVDTRFVTLHVGPGTFAPIRSDNLSDIHLHAEAGSIPEETAAAIRDAKADGRRVVAVGTTTTRLLEAVFAEYGEIVPMSGDVDLFIRPPFTFQVVGGLITNFHLPRSTLLMLVSAFAGYERIRSAYRHAVCQRYRFYSFGDAMLIL